MIFCSLVFPTSYIIIKILLLGIVSLQFILWVIREKKVFLDKELVLVVLFTVAISGLYIMLGAFRGEPGAYRVITVYLFWPLLYLGFFSVLIYEYAIHSVIKVFIYALITITIYSYLYIGYELGLIPRLLYINFDLGQSIGFYDGYMEFSMYSVSSLLYLIPFCIAGLFVWDHEFYNKIRISKKLVVIFTILGIIVSVLSGRRALWLVIIFSFIVIFLLNIIVSNSSKLHNIRKLFVFSVFVVLISIISIPLINNYIDLDFHSLINKFDFQAEYERSSQFKALIDGWKESPLFGNGYGAVASVIRSEETPWAYELQYIDLLFKTGVIGFLVYGLVGIWVVKKTLNIAKRIKESRMVILPMLTGVLAFLVANATNPYLLKFDYIWVLIFPIGIINHYLHRSFNSKYGG